MNNVVNVNYISYWEGCDDVETTAQVDLSTGEVMNIKSIDVDDDYEICEAEFVQYKDGSMEQVVSYDDGRYFIISKSKEQYKSLEINDTKHLVSEEFDENDVCRICGIAY